MVNFVLAFSRQMENKTREKCQSVQLLLFSITDLVNNVLYNKNNFDESKTSLEFFTTKNTVVSCNF